MRPRPLLGGSVILLVACRGAAGPGDGVAGTGNVVPGIDAEVVDARSGAYVARGARGTVRDGAFSGRLGPVRGRCFPPEDTLISLRTALRATRDARGRGHAVAVARDGDQPWRRTGVRAMRGECHATTVPLIARLEPAS